MNDPIDLAAARQARAQRRHGAAHQDAAVGSGASIPGAAVETDNAGLGDAMQAFGRSLDVDEVLAEAEAAGLLHVADDGTSGPADR